MSFDSQRVEEIVSTALAMAVEERMAYLDAACGSDVALRAWVEALLKARAEAAALGESDGSRRQGADDRHVATSVRESASVDPAPRTKATTGAPSRR